MIYNDILTLCANKLRGLIDSKIFIWLLIFFRIFNCLFVVTSFYPDEYFQSVEIAHFWAYGYGHMSWEWEPCVALRSVITPFIYYVLFLFLKLINIDHPVCVLYIPKLCHGICAALCDLGIYKLLIYWYVELYNDVWIYEDNIKRNEKDEDNGNNNNNNNDNNNNNNNDNNNNNNNNDNNNNNNDNNNYYYHNNILYNTNDIICTILCCHFFCWFYFYSICRTSSHSFECLFNIWGVYFLSQNYDPLKNQLNKIEKIDLLLQNDVIIKKGKKNLNECTNLKERRNDHRFDTYENNFIYEKGTQNCKQYDKNVCDKNVCDKNVCDKNVCDKNVCGQNMVDHIIRNRNNMCRTHFYSSKFNKIEEAKNLLFSLFFSSLSVIFRPNALVFWLSLYILYFIKNIFEKQNKINYKEIFKISVTYTFFFLTIIIIIDSYYFGHITFPFWNFFVYNFLSGSNKYFGGHSFFFYFVCVIPSIYLTLTPFLFYGYYIIYNNILNKIKYKTINIYMYILKRIDWIVYLVTHLEILSLSFSKHKEHKIVIGYIPFLTIFVGYALYLIKLHYKKDNGKNKKNIYNNNNNNNKIQYGNITIKGRNKYIFLFSSSLFTNISFLLQFLCILFFCLIHNRSPEYVASYFRNLETKDDQNIYIFITNCYDIPLYSHIHRKFNIGFLDCSPYDTSIDEATKNWRKRIYEDKFKQQFFNMFQEKKNNNHHINSTYGDTITPYIIPDISFYWFGHHHFNKKNNFQYIYQNINLSCLNYRFHIPLHGQLPTYIVTTTIELTHLQLFLSTYNYKLETKPFFSYFRISEAKGIVPVYHYIFKRVPS
ncbi:dolichyl-phosphate-mannose-glygolipidalpha-mannosyltransferase, putative [Plasmodium reichenowi]|uniref:Mannosyltransferase n=1 Tax=Plasmodium reichenowi TaxID=5854 RepID=A0A060RXL9_PLARE|nr:dolichyl-phosphate-mannose-glygolipidalpha-mannosyltransferase, putative [Plasmodium reichenowi]